MKNAILILLLTVVVSFAGSVTLAWDPVPGATNYILYAHTNSFDNSILTNAVVKVNVGTNTSVWISQLQTGQWWFAAAAVRGGVQSDLSNFVIADSPPTPANTRVVTGLFGPSVTSMSNVFLMLQVR